MAELTPAEIRNIRSKCTKFLSGNRPRNQRQWLEQLATSPLAEAPLDGYSNGAGIQALEQEVAELLGKESAVFMHKAVIAQQIALRIWAERSHCNNVALHYRSHIEMDEANAYQRLTGLTGIRIGRSIQPFTVAELAGIHEPLGAVTIELPLRAAGCKLPSWEELTAIADWTRSHNVPLHIDGARLWESTPFYGRSLAEISALADSVYVSFYKGLGGLGGCILAGPAEFIEEAKVWRTRYGGSLYTIFPYIISATEGLHNQLPKMEGYYQQAGKLAAALSELPGVVCAPNPPHTNTFQLYLPGEPEVLHKASMQIAREEGRWLFGWFQGTALPNITIGEIVVGEVTADWTEVEVVEAIAKMLEVSKQLQAD